MIKGAKELLLISEKLDELKESAGSIDITHDMSKSRAFPASPFLLFYGLNNMFGNIHEIDIDAIRITIENEEDRRNAMLLASVFTQGSVWTDMFAFNAFACMANGKDYSVGIIEDLSAEDIAWAVCLISGIEGSTNLPFSHNVLTAIAAHLKDDGWIIPPLSLMFNNISNYMDNNEQRDHIMHVFLNISSFTYDDSIQFDQADDNYYKRSALIGEHIKERLGRLTTEWARHSKDT